MMGFGSFGNGGSSSSSSNLSSLAPPFTVGRTVSNPNSNPLVNFMNEPPPPYGGATYNSSLHSWVPSIPAPKLGNYSVPLPSLNISVVDATGAFSYGQYTDSVTTTVVDEVKPYYPSYVSPAITGKNALVGLGDSTYDFLSACSLTPADVTSQDDYTKSLSGWGSSTLWDGSWNGSGDLESGKCTDSDWSLYSNKTNVTGPTICQDYVKPGSGFFKDLSTSAKTCDVPLSFDVIGRENCTGYFSANQSDGKSFIPQNFEFSQSKSSTSGASKFGTVSTSVSPGTHRQLTSLESIANSSSSKKTCNAKHDICLRQYNTCPDNFTLATKSPPALVVRPPAGGACSSQLNLKSYKDGNYNGTDVAGQNADFSRKRLSNVNNPHLTLSSEENEGCANPSRFSIYLEKNGQDVADTPSRGALSSNKSITKDAFYHLSKETDLHVPQTSSPDIFPLVLDEAKSRDSVENSSKSADPYNPAEDSPCWKGATSSRFSPFEISEAVAPLRLAEMSESCGGSSLHGPQILPSLSNDAVRDISRKLSENCHYSKKRSLENGLSPSKNRPSIATYSFGEHRLNSSNAAWFISEQNCDGLHFSYIDQASTKESSLPDNNKIYPDHRPLNTTEPLLQELSFTSEKCVRETCCAHTEMNPNDASENGPSHVPIHTTEDVLSSLCGENALGNLTKLHGEGSTPIVDVPMLVKTMHNLSDLLLFYCSNDACVLKEQDHVALKHVNNNLNACILKSPQLPLKRNSVCSPQGTTHFLGESPDHLQGASVDRVHVTEIVSANAVDELDNQQIHEETMQNILQGRKDVKFRDLVPVHNDADMVKTDGVAQALKKVFIENFHGEEETLPQVLLYKNLWLEAEAVICSTNFRARYDRMKNEMEKCMPREAKDVSKNMMDVEHLSNSKVYPDVITASKLASDTQSGIHDSPIISTTSHAADVLARFHMLNCRDDNSTSMNTMDAAKVSSSNVFPDLKEVDKLAPQDSDSLASETYVKGSPISSKIRHADDDVEDSVMARFRILKCRVDNSSSMDMGGKQLQGVVDLGFVGKKEHSPDTRDGLKDGTFNTTMGHDLQHPIDGCTEYKSTANETSLCRNDTVIQSCGTDDKLGNQHSPGWYDSSSFDWEHVLKDDFAWHY